MAMPPIGKGDAALAGLSGSADAGGSEPSTYDADMKVALSDLAAALGIPKVKDPGRGIEALKTLHDLCARAESDEGMGE